MANWTTVSHADVENYVVAALVTAIDEAALGDTQLDRFTLVQADVTAMVRMSVASCKSNELDTNTTKIPNSLRPAASWLIANYMAVGLGVTLTEQQANEVTNAREQLKEVARCDLVIEEPDSPDDDPESQGGPGAQLVTSSDRVYTRDTMLGL